MAYIPLFYVNAAFLIYWSLRLKKQAAIPLFCLLIGFRVMTNQIGFNPPCNTYEQKSVANIRVMTYNVHSFTSLYEPFNDSVRSGILSVVDAQQPDIIAFQEYYTLYGGKFDTRDSLKKRFGTGTQYSYFQAFTTASNAASGLAIFTKIPIIGRGEIRLNDDGTDTKAIYADLKKGDKIFRLYCVHLQSYQFDEEDYAYIDKASGEGQTDLKGSFHIIRRLKYAFIIRARQVKMLRQHMDKCPYPYIVTGDFNDTPSSYAFNYLKGDLKNTFNQKGCGIGKTYNGDFPNFQIDYILASPQFNTINYAVIEKKLSDHYPVRADLYLK